MKSIRKHRIFLAGLCNLSPQQRIAVLKYSSKDQINCLAEVVLNLLRNNLSLTPTNRAQLKKHRTKLRKLVCPKTTVAQRRKLLVQKGGFLPYIIKPIVSLLGTILPGLFGSK
jgi:hypothetical protein